MFHKTILTAAILLGACTSIQISDAIQKQRSQLKWRQEATNTFSWNATQKLSWSVVNAFIDVQTSPDGDVYAIQSIESELQAKKYFVYLYNIVSNIWTLTDPTFQAKAVRFDRLGNIYYLDQNNCILNSQKQKIICGASDFEVTAKKEIYLLHDGLSPLPKDTLSSPWRYVGVEDYQYKALSGYKGITLLKDQPILIQSDGTVDINYGGEKLVSISAGIDGSLWALKQEENVVNYQLLKWQTSAQKWYIVSGARGINLSAYNELSVAIVDEKGLLSLSSQAGHQDEAQYTSVVGPPYNPGTGTPYTPGIGTPGTPGAPLLPIDKTITGDPNAPAIVLENPLPIAPPQLPVIIGQSPDSFVTFQTFKTFTDEVNLSFNKNIKSLTQVFTSKSNVKTRDEAMTAILNLWNIFGFIKTTSGQMIGFYYEDPQLSTSIDNQLTNTRTMIYGITNNHFSKKEFDDVFQPQFGPFPSQRYMQIIKTPRARITFYPQCFNTAPSPNVAECYSDSNFEQPAYCFWIQSKLQHDFGTFDCEQIEYYHGKSQ